MLSADIGRQAMPVRKRLDECMRAYMERMTRYMPGRTEAERHKQFFILFSGMSGAIAMLRAFGDENVRDYVLGLTREYYIQLFSGA